MKKSCSINYKLLILTSIIVIIGTIGISYYTLLQMTARSNRLIHGRPATVLAEELKQSLLHIPGARNVAFRTSDNLLLSGIFIQRKHAQFNTIICHGYQGRKEFLHNFAEIFYNANILFFDFRAHGESEGDLTTIGYHEAEDVAAAVRTMKEDLQPPSLQNPIPTIVLGISMGGAAALRAAHQQPHLCDALIIDSTYQSLRKIIYRTLSRRTALPSFPFHHLMIWLFHKITKCNIDEMNTSDMIQSVNIPLLLIHSSDDSFIKPKSSLTLFNNAPSSFAKLWIGPKCKHGWLSCNYPELYKKKVISFLEKTFPHHAKPQRDEPLLSSHHQKNG